jgi:hypothetical protein
VVTVGMRHAADLDTLRSGGRPYGGGSLFSRRSASFPACPRYVPMISFAPFCCCSIPKAVQMSRVEEDDEVRRAAPHTRRRFLTISGTAMALAFGTNLTGRHGQRRVERAALGPVHTRYRVR